MSGDPNVNIYDGVPKDVRLVIDDYTDLTGDDINIEDNDINSSREQKSSCWKSCCCYYLGPILSVVTFLILVTGIVFIVLGTKVYGVFDTDDPSTISLFCLF